MTVTSQTPEEPRITCTSFAIGVDPTRTVEWWQRAQRLSAVDRGVEFD